MILAKTQYDERMPLPSDISFEGDKGLTKISDAKDTDINVIFKRIERSGQLPDIIAKNGSYGDFSEVPTYQEAVEIVKRANEQFEALDVNVRNRFENNPEKFLAFVGDENNIEEMGRMGLLKPEKVAAMAAAKQAADDAAKAAQKAANDKAEADLIKKIKASL